MKEIYIYHDRCYSKYITELIYYCSDVRHLPHNNNYALIIDIY